MIRSRSWKNWLVGAVTVAAILACDEEAQAYQDDSPTGGKIVIEGTVFDGSESAKPLDGATVTAYTGKGKLLATATTKDGKYRLEFDKSELEGKRAAFDLYYFHGAWHDQTLPFLTGKELKYQAIDKVLPLREGPTGFLDIIEEINIYKWRFALAAGSPDSQKAISDLISDPTYRAKIEGIPNPDHKNIQLAPGQVKAFAGLSPEQEAVIRERLATLYKHYKIPVPEQPGEAMYCPPVSFEVRHSRCLRLFRR
jgi:hypothetical protein